MEIDDPLFIVIVPPVGANVTPLLTVNAPAITKLVLYCVCAVGVAAIVNPLNRKDVPELEIVDPAADIVIVPPEGLNVAVELLVNVPATLKLLDVVTVADEGIVKLWKVAVPLFEIDEPLFIVIVPPLGVNVPVTDSALVTVAVDEPVTVPLIVRFLYV